MTNHSYSQTLTNGMRIELVDALRGLALLGIIIANIAHGTFAEDGSGVYAGSRYIIGSQAFDSVLEMLVSFLIDKKFITIFSILFGFGFSVQLKAIASTRTSFNKYFTYRMLLLLAIGCIHGYLLWFGDIIRDYAICGLFLLLVHKWPLRRIFWMALILAVPITAIVYILNAALNL